MRLPSRLLFTTVASATALLLASCDVFGPREEEYEFEEVDCGETPGPRNPDPTVTELPAVLSGSAVRLPDGGVEIVLAPIIVSATGSVVADLEASRLEIDVEGSVVADFELARVSNEFPASADIIFVLDTTGSMAWALDGVKTGIDLFLDGIDATGFDVRIGGIEFGDGVRTSVDLGSSSDFRTWLDAMTVAGGGDAAENPLQAIAAAHDTMGFRDGAMRYYIVITDQGMHERSDGSECSQTNLADVVSEVRGTSLFAVVHAALGEPAGLHPDWLTRTMGGLYVGLDIAESLADFNISLDTEADDILGSSHVVRLPPGSADPGAASVHLRYDLDGTMLEVELPIEGA